MTESSRKSGIDVVGDVPWSTHLCQFYQTEEDLADILVPYFKSGLENNEFCMWVTSEPLNEKEAKATLKKAVKNLDDYIKKGQIEIVPHSEWYLKDGVFDLRRVLNAWIDKLNHALSRGYDGIRVTGNIAWLEKGAWGSFKDYEAELDQVIGGYPMIAICTYPLTVCGAPEIIDVVSNHRFALIRRKDKWVVIESAERARVEETLRKFKTIADIAGYGVAIGPLDGTLTYVNRAFAEMHGRSPEELIGQHYSILYTEEQMAAINKLRARLMQTGSFTGEEIWHKKKDGTVFPTLMTGNLIRDEEGNPLFIVGSTIDITERKRMEQETERFKTVVENANYGVSMATLNNKFIYTNKAYAKMHGYEVDELIGKRFTELYSKEQLPVILRLNDQLLQTGSFVNEEVWHSKKDGTIFPTLMSASLMSDDRGKPLYKVGTTLDITERKQAEEEYQNIIRTTRDGFWVLDTQGRFLDVNDAYCALTGYSREELLNMSIPDIEAIETPEETAQRIQQITKTGHARFETRHRCKNGRIVNIEISTTYAGAGDDRLFVFARDITERKKAEEALQESEERYRALVEAGARIGEAIVLLQNTEKVEAAHVFANQEWARITGYTVEELKEISYWDLIHPRDRDAVADRVRRRHKGENIPGLYQITVVTKDGAEVPVETAAGVTIIYNNKPASVGYIRDITERKRAEEDIKESEAKYRAVFTEARDGIVLVDAETTQIVDCNQEYERQTGRSLTELRKLKIWETRPPHKKQEAKLKFQEVIEKGMESYAESEFQNPDGKLVPIEFMAKNTVIGGRKYVLSISRDITEREVMEEERLKFEKLESIGILAGGIAHDFNNILTGILGNITLAKRHVETESKAAERLLDAEKACLRAKDLTHQLLTYSKGGAPVKKIASIAELLEETTMFALRGSKVKCEFSLPDDLWAVEVDQGQMGQVITNIVINADEAMPGGGIINIGARNTVIKRKGVLPLPKGDYVEITVKDYGIGIPKEHIGRVFDPYFTTKQKGSGLGLATAYSVVRNHHGYINVESELGVGTTFHIYLPASEKPAPEKKEAAEEVPVHGKGRVLVMDDEEMVREVLRRALSLAGYEVELTSDGAEAVELYQKARESGRAFDAVILDLTVPGGMGGKEAIKKLLEIDPEVKAIVSSGYATDPIMADFKKYGFSAVVTKPYSVGELERTLHRMLR